MVVSKTGVFLSASVLLIAHTCAPCTHPIHTPTHRDIYIFNNVWCETFHHLHALCLNHNVCLENIMLQNLYKLI